MPKKKAQTVASIRALAPVIGMSHTMLNRHFKRGKFKAEAGGGFDPEKVRAALKRNGDIIQPSQAKGGIKLCPPVKQVDPDAEESEISADSAFGEYNKAKAARERVRLERDEMALATRKLELVSAAEVKEAWGRMISSTRSSILLLPGKLAPKLAALGDVREVQAVIEAAVRSLLTELSEYRPNECALPIN